MRQVLVDYVRARVWIWIALSMRYFGGMTAEETAEALGQSAAASVSTWSIPPATQRRTLGFLLPRLDWWPLPGSPSFPQ
jgi:hypothetical protein